MAINVAELEKVANGSEKDKVNWYADRIQEGMTDAEIAAAVDAALGTDFSSGASSDWQYLQQQAAKQIITESAGGSAKDKATAYNQLLEGIGLNNDEIQEAIVNTAGKQDPNDIRALLGMAGAQRASELKTPQEKAEYVKQMVGYGYTPAEIANYINTAVGPQSNADMQALFGLAGVKLPSAQPVAQTGKFNTGITYSPDMNRSRTGTGVDISGESGIRQAYAPYVERLLERASAEADVPFQKYTGESPLLESARAGIANLTTPAQFLQGSNLAQAAGLGALEYGKYKPTSFTTGTFANPDFNKVLGPNIDIANLKEISKSSDPNAKAEFYRNYMTQADRALQDAANQYAGMQSPTDWNALQNLAGFNLINTDALQKLGQSNDPNAKADFYRNYMTQADQALQNATNRALGQQNPADWAALQNLAGYGSPIRTFDAGGAVAGGGGVFDPQQALAAREAESPSYNTTGLSKPTDTYSDNADTFDWSKVGPIDVFHGQLGAPTTGGTYDSQVGVFGPDGRMYSTPQAAQRNGVTNYTYEPPNNTATTNPNLQPVNYGGQNVTNVQASYMSPYMQGVIDPAIREARRQSDIMGQANAAKAVGAGAFGGSRYGLTEAERQRNLATQLGDIQSKGLQEAYMQGLGQFNTEQNRGLEAQKLAEASRQFGAELGLKGLQTGIQASTALGDLGYRQNLSDLAILKQMADLGTADKTFDYNEFLRGEKYPYQNLEFMKSILGAVPGAALSPAAEGGSAIPGGTADAFSTFLQALQGMGKIIPGGASGGLISGIATLGD